MDHGNSTKVDDVKVSAAFNTEKKMEGLKEAFVPTSIEKKNADETEEVREALSVQKKKSNEPKEECAPISMEKTKNDEPDELSEAMSVEKKKTDEQEELSGVMSVEKKKTEEPEELSETMSVEKKKPDEPEELSVAMTVEKKKTDKPKQVSATITIQPDEPEVEKIDEQQKMFIRRKRKMINPCSSNNNDYPIQYPLYDDNSMKREDKPGKLSTPVTLRNTDEQRNREKREINPYWSWGYNDFLDDYPSDYPVYPTVHEEEANWSDTTSTFSSKLICHL